LAASNIDVISEYRDLIKSLALNLNELHSRIQILEKCQKDSIKSE
jgi:hypothetical protein